MVDPLSRNLQGTGVQKALMTPKVASSDLVLQLATANTMQGNYGEPNNKPKGYPEFVSDSKFCFF